MTLLPRIAYLMMTITTATAVVHCGSLECDDCGEPKPPSTVLQNTESCPTSTPPLTRASLLDHFAGDFVGRAARADAGDASSISVDTMTVKLEATTGVVNCEPSFSSGLGGFVPATVHADVRITIQSTSGAPMGVMQGTVARRAGVNALDDVTFNTRELDPAMVGYTPKTAGAKVRVHGVLHPGGTLSAIVYERSGATAVPVIEYAP